ncbi:hypothetical protein [Nocardia neocaledoniensis]|uniref:hypothetical protein n=1 Tax=Nocardia neocaledoniensis TaxID=236511 RepID=UPI000D71CF5F|nr:hypothetical protein [Nocardia neocaledoniensis]
MVIDRIGRWIGATRPRRWTVRVLLVLLALTVFPAVLGAAATASSDPESGASATNSALSWMDVRDSYGVELSDYFFATDFGSVIHPENTAIATIINLEFAGWLVIVTTAIWLIGYVLSFAWLDLIANALRGVSEAAASQIATPVMLATAVSIGAFFVAYFVIRGLHAKAAMQVATMFAVAVIGPFFLAAPLAEIMSSHGLLASGRDVGVGIAAGLNGDGTSDPTQLVETIQGTMAENFARRPLQVWNFGHVVDNRANCAVVWTVGVNSGDDERLKEGMRTCGDSAAYRAAADPSVGQIGAGLLLIICAGILLGFSVVLAKRILRGALDAIYHGFLAIVGFAAGGFIYGPTQTFLVRNIVDSAVGALEMTFYTVALGFKMLLLGNIFRLAGDDVMAVFVIAALIESVAISQLKRAGRSFDESKDWVVSRVSQALRGADATPVRAGGGAAVATGMGSTGLLRTLPHALIAGFAAASTVSNSPLTEWALGKVPRPLRPYARLQKEVMLSQAGIYTRPGLGGADGWHVQTMLNRPVFARAALRGAQAFGGIDTVMGAAGALMELSKVGGGLDAAAGALHGAGFRDQDLILNAVYSWGTILHNSEDETLANKPLGRVVAAMQRAQHSALSVARGGGDMQEAAADIATLRANAALYREAYPGGVTLDGGAEDGPQRAFVSDYMANPTSPKILALQKLSGGEALNEDDHAKSGGLLTGIDPVDAARMMQWIGNEDAKRTLEAVGRIVENPADVQLWRDARRTISNAASTDQWSAGLNRTTTNSLAPPPSDQPNPGSETVNWAALKAIANRTRR